MIDSSGRNPRKTNKHSRVWRLRYYDPSGRLLTPRPSTMTSAIFLDDGSLSPLLYGRNWGIGDDGMPSSTGTRLWIDSGLANRIQLALDGRGRTARI